MKITLNLARPRSFRERYSIALGVPTVIVGIALLFVLGHYAAADYREYLRLQKDLGVLETRKSELEQRAARLQTQLHEPQALSTLREAQFVNDLIDQKRLSLSQLTEKLAALLPPEVRLSNLVLLRSGNESDMHFQVAGKNEQALGAFLQNVRDSSDFADLTFTNLGFQDQASGGGDITVVCQTRYVGLVEAAKPARGKSPRKG